MPVIKPDGTILRGPELRVLPKTDGKRRCSDWLAAFLDHTSELKAPTCYLRWSGLSTLAAVAQRKIFQETQDGTIFPNIYVWLVGPPGTGKGVAIRAGKRLLAPEGKSLDGVYFTPDAPSVVGIMREFEEIEVVKKHHQSLNAFIFELSTLFENAGESMYGFLTAIYDGDPGYYKRTRVGDKEQIPFPWLNMIAGVTPRWLGDNLSKGSSETGLLARVKPVYSEEISFANPESRISPEYRRREEMLTHDLAHILPMEGQFEWEGGRTDHGDNPCTTACGCGDAFKWFDSWFRNRERLPRIPDPRTWYYYVRKPVHLKKVAMLVSLAKRDTLKWHIEDFITALALLESIESDMKRAYSAVGTNPYATELERIAGMIRSAGRLNKQEIALATYNNLDDAKFEMTLRSIESLGFAKKVLTDKGVYYEAINATL